jgi:tetratricopeptide (TPR) repeat protein
VAEKLLARTGMTDVERDFLQKALRYYERFADEKATEPSDRAARGEAYNRMGMIHWKLQEYDQTGEDERRATAIYESLVQEFPGNADYELGLSTGYAALGWVLGSKSPSEAERLTRQSVSLLERLVAKYPDQPLYRIKLAGGLTRLGWDMMHYQGRDQEGEPILRRVSHVLKPLVETKSPDIGALRALAVSDNLLTDMLREQSRFAEMNESIRASVHYWEMAMQDPTGEPEYEHQMQPFDWFLSAQAYLNLGDARTRAGDFEGAAAALRRSQVIAEKLTTDFPKVPSYPEHLTFAHEKRAFLAAAMNHPQKAQEEYRQAIEVTDRTLTRFPHMAGHSHYLARLLVRAPYARLRDPRRAIKLAKQGLGEYPARPDFWTTLGIGQYQNGSWKDAAASFEKSVELSKGGDTETWYYLAMTYAKLGDRSKAEEWHRRAAASMRDEHKSKDKDLLRLQAEAAEVMRSFDAPRTEVKEGLPRND